MTNVFLTAEKCVDIYTNKWDNVFFSEDMLPQYSRTQKKQKQKNLDAAISSIFGLLEDFPEQVDDRQTRISELKKKVKGFAKEHFDTQNPSLEEIMIDGFMEVTEQFINQANTFDPSLKMIDIMQAIRNVWIMNLIQMLVGRKIEYTSSIFAYSMLYPYTDNYLDDPQVTIKEKEKFNHRLSLRLKGGFVEPIGEIEEKVYKLIEMIESQYSRNKYQDVYDSILSIQQGQIKSISQQTGKSLMEKDVLFVSAEKGGSSVLADAYLVCGKLDENLFEFAFCFGFILQMIDDLQDADNDSLVNHYTLFSLKVEEKKKFDDTVNKLIAFVKTALDYEKAGNTPYFCDIKKIITDNCILMIFEAVSKNKKHFTKSYYKFTKKRSSIDLKYFLKAEKKIKSKMHMLDEKGLI